MHVERISAFCDGSTGGNPAGVVICDEMPGPEFMQAVASKVGYSETVFAVREGGGWRARFFSPAFEVDFCGHATIALGGVLASRYGNEHFALKLNKANITVEGKATGGKLWACLNSPPTFSQALSAEIVAEALEVFSLGELDLDPAILPALAHAGNNHLVLCLTKRSRLSSMAYDLGVGADFMRRHNFTTICLIHVETAQRFHVRNAFAIGGVVEDPATGSAAAALAGYLRDIGWNHHGFIEIIQGEDMGARSIIEVKFSNNAGSSVRVSGNARSIQDPSAIIEDLNHLLGGAAAS